MRKESRNEDAVSPVIGVMLMLVVTVVIAAVVVMFSTGLAGSTETTPTALFEVSYTGTWNSEYGSELANVGLRHKGGDVIPLKDLQITLESEGGINSGIVLTHQAIDTKTKNDMVVGDYEVSQSDLDTYNLWKKGYDDALSLINEMTQKYSITEDIITYGNWEDPRWDELQAKYQISDDDMWDLSDAPEKYQNRVKLITGAGWSIEDGPSPKASGGEEYEMSVLGQGKPTESTVSTGDIIHIVPFDGSSLNTRIFEGTSVKWTISYIPTNSIIAKGEFEVIAD